MTNERTVPSNARGNNLLKLTLAVSLALASLVTSAHAQDAADVAKAKAEGKVIWYTSTPIEQGQKIADAFQKETGIKVEMFRSGGSAILRRFQQEMDAGRVAADVLTHSEPAAANALGKKGLFVAFKPANFDKVPDAAKDPNGLFVGQRLNMMTHYLRSDKVADADEPATSSPDSRPACARDLASSIAWLCRAAHRV